MQDNLYDMTYAKMEDYWKVEVGSWLPAGVSNRILGIAACALSEDVTLPKVLSRYMVAAIVRENDPSRIKIIDFKQQADELIINLITGGEQYINLCQKLDNNENIKTKLKLLNQGWSFSDRRDIELIIPRKDLLVIIKQKMLSDEAWCTQMHNALLAEKQTFLAPSMATLAPKAASSSR